MHSVSLGDYYYYQKTDSTSLVIRKPQIQILFYHIGVENFYKGFDSTQYWQASKKSGRHSSNQWEYILILPLWMAIQGEGGCRRGEVKYANAVFPNSSQQIKYFLSSSSSFATLCSLQGIYQKLFIQVLYLTKQDQKKLNTQSPLSVCKLFSNLTTNNTFLSVSLCRSLQ